MSKFWRRLRGKNWTRTRPGANFSISKRLNHFTYNYYLVIYTKRSNFFGCFKLTLQKRRRYQSNQRVDQETASSQRKRLHRGHSYLDLLARLQVQPREDQVQVWPLLHHQGCVSGLVRQVGSGLNFNNIIHAAFLYASVAHSFFELTVYRKY